jgi:hypothetical protein
MDSLISVPLFIAPREIAWLDMGIEDLEEVLLEMNKYEFEEGMEVRLLSVVQKIAVTEGVRKRLDDGFRKLGEVLREREVTPPSAT